jgi:dihydroneopterin aldolase
LDRLIINQLVSECFIGLYSHEQERRQKLTIDVVLQLDVKQAAESNDLIYTVDYHGLSQEIDFMLGQGRYQLIEAVAEMLARYILLSRSEGPAVVHAVAVRLTKPEALNGKGIPAIEVVRTRSEARSNPQETPWGWIQPIYSHGNTQVSLLKIEPGKEPERPGATKPLSSGLILEVLSPKGI